MGCWRSISKSKVVALGAWNINEQVHAQALLWQHVANFKLIIIIIYLSQLLQRKNIVLPFTPCLPQMLPCDCIVAVVPTTTQR